MKNKNLTAINRIEEQSKTLTAPYFRKLATKLLNYDIGIGQAGVYIHGTPEEISNLVALKVEKGVESYQKTLEEIEKNLKIKYGTFDVGNSDDLKKVLTEIKLPEDQDIDVIARNMITIMKQIEDLKTVVVDNYRKHPLTGHVLEYFFIKRGFVLDILELTASTYKALEFIDSIDILNLHRASINLSTVVDITDNNSLIKCISEILPNAREFYKINNSTFQIIPIEHSNSLIGFSTFGYSIPKGKIPVGVGDEVIEVHYNYLLKKRLYTIDHDYQHALDILVKSIIQDFILQKGTLDPKGPYAELLKLGMENKDLYLCKNNLLQVYERIKSTQSDDTETINSKLSDMLVLFYILHENPSISPGFLKTRKYKAPKKDAYMDDIEFNIETTKALGAAIFDCVGYVVPFSQIYSDFQRLLESKTNFKISNINNKLTLTIDHNLIDKTQIEYLGKLVAHYMGISIEKFYTRYSDLNELKIVMEKLKNDFTELKSMSADFDIGEATILDKNINASEHDSQTEIISVNDFPHDTNEQISLTGKLEVQEFYQV